RSSRATSKIWEYTQARQVRAFSVLGSATYSLLLGATLNSGRCKMPCGWPCALEAEPGYAFDRNFLVGRFMMSRMVLALSLVGTLFLTAARAQTAPTTSAPAATATPSSAPTHQGRKKRVAVFDFDYATVQSYSSAMFGTNVDVGRGISDLT